MRGALDGGPSSICGFLSRRRKGVRHVGNKGIEALLDQDSASGVEAGALLRGTLICEDSERAIIDAVNEFSSESSRKTGRNWFVEILRPDLSPVFLQRRFSNSSGWRISKSAPIEICHSKTKNVRAFGRESAKARLRAEPAK